MNRIMKLATIGFAIRLVVPSSVVVVAAAALAGAAAPSSLAATCTPQAHVPFVVNSFTSGAGTATCDAGAPSWQYTVRLTGANGQVLKQSQGSRTGTQTVTTSAFYCLGWSLHSFLYINVGGAGKSHTSGNTTCT
ncbi:MAG: hypothetical protein OEW65_11995 [Thermoleophilia bacterium]|nr:hypothetical protein [Thermoleophilia bacterium]